MGCLSPRLGFDNIIMFQNDSDDGTGKIMQTLAKAGVVQYLYNSAPRGTHQVRAYKRATRQAGYLSADWIMALDLDEFLVINTDDGTLGSLISALPAKTDCAFLNWKRFGTGHQRKIDHGLVTDRFTLCEYDRWVANRTIPFKSLFRNEKFLRPGVHRPRLKKGDTAPRTYVNGSGLREGAFELRNYQCSDPEMRKLAQINHYITRDAQSFTLKAYKGSAHQANRSIDHSYWTKRNKNQMEDLRVQRFRDRLIAEMDRINAATDGVIGQLTRLAVDAHKDRFRQIVADPAMAKLHRFCASRPQVPDALRVEPAETLTP